MNKILSEAKILAIKKANEARVRNAQTRKLAKLDSILHQKMEREKQKITQKRNLIKQNFTSRFGAQMKEQEEELQHLHHTCVQCGSDVDDNYQEIESESEGECEVIYAERVKSSSGNNTMYLRRIDKPKNIDKYYSSEVLSFKGNIKFI